MVGGMLTWSAGIPVSCRKQLLGRGLKMAACMSRCSMSTSPMRDSSSCHGSLFSSSSMLTLDWPAPEASCPLLEGFLCIKSRSEDSSTLLCSDHFVSPFQANSEQFRHRYSWNRGNKKVTQEGDGSASVTCNMPEEPSRTCRMSTL